MECAVVILYNNLKIVHISILLGERNAVDYVGNAICNSVGNLDFRALCAFAEECLEHFFFCLCKLKRADCYVGEGTVKV